MGKNFIWGLLVFSVMMLTVSVITPNLNAKPVKARGVINRTVTIPKHAIEVVPGKVFWLGTAIEKGRLVEGYAIIHHKKGFGKPSGGCNGDGKCQGWEDQSCDDCQSGGGGTETSSCYGFMSKGARWRKTEPYIVDPSNSQGLDEEIIRSIVETSIEKWDGWVGSFDIIGSEVPGTVNGADLISPDNQNEVLFGNVDSPGAIAVTVVWGIFSGPPKGRELVEWDQVYDQEDFDWSLDGDLTAMDFENITTHELGHAFGLDDLYTACTEETMYGYASEGEVKKRDLNYGDITGVQTLYK
jgi:hypothetical protein